VPNGRSWTAWIARVVAIGLVAGAVFSGAGSGSGVMAQQGSAAPPSQQPLPGGQTAAGGQAGGQQPPVFRAGVNFVRVDVIVSDKSGAPVTDLKAEDFDVTEDGRPQQIDLFKLVNTDGNPQPGADPAKAIRSRYDEEAEAARDDVRLFVIFLDDYHVRLGNSMRVRDPLVKFLTTQVGPLDMVAVMTPLMSVQDVNFTRDHDNLTRIIRQFEGRKYDYRPRNVVEEKYAYYPTQTIETLRNQISISALEGLCVKLGSLREGRKSIILVSEGFTALLPPQMRDASAALPGVGNSAARSPLAGDNALEDRSRFQAQIDLEQWMKDVYAAANKNNAAIYTLDPRGLAVGEFDVADNIAGRVDSETLNQTQNTLRTLAEETDGRAIVNQNDLDRGLKQLIRDSSAYYLVGYNSSAKTDGKFHKIEVKVKRPGVQLRSRKGYWAATAAEAAVAAEPPKPRPPAAVEKAIGTMEARPRDALTTTWVQMVPGEGGKTKVTFVWEPLPATIGVSRQEPVAMQIVASSAAGETCFRGRVPEVAPADAAPATPVASAPGATAVPAAPAKPARVSFDAPPGRLQLRMSVENAKGQNIDTSSQEVQVPDFTGLAVRLTAPAVFRARTAREFQALSRDPDPVPTALREFRRTDRLLVRFVTVGPGTGAPEVTVRMLNRTGVKMLDLTPKAPGEGADYYQLDLPLAGFAAGDYLIEVTATSGESKVTELVAMKVTG
jgi:VWFA-related protein